ncbi:MAG: hypothetical protein PHF93_06650 [Acidobacteriota bacterium]|jgi:hypothetical protein|nr:hypothetical protein [Acidobacteriota bacterium]MDD8033482.1 hypothetical protein [Acidobacteriota bacterium]MDD8038704.1 hypothetical protein [Acidobacteriota bacterium]HOF82246.1 hypothetical protein [Candidatus Aminicenantes bacterium]HQF98117.1 hypothetical protein [Candidatus Aminicenantes bacterium]
MKKIPKPAVFALMGCLFAALPGAAQAPPDDLEALKKTAPRIFIDCGSCDLEYIKDEIPFVNYVRDRKEADVHVLITTQTTASEGKEYTLTFMGRDGFSGIDDSIRYYSKKDDTEDDVRKGLVRTLKQGLAAYVVRTPIASRLQVRYSPENGPAAGPDRWNHWLFNISVDGYLEGEESASKGSIGLNATASRVTEEWKLRLGFSSSFRRDSFVYQGTKIESSQESYGASGLLVKSLSPHWSAGLALDADSSSYGNIAFRLVPAPAIEYNLFSYAESSRRQLRFLYRLRFENVRYREPTIYDKTRDRLWGESLSVTLDLKEKWGFISSSLSGAHYFHDFKKNNLTLNAFLQLNLVKGLSAYLFASGSRVHDQLALARGTATLEEILLERRELATSYSYFAIFGLSFTFGSAYTNVVNPRFGQLGGGDSGGVTIRVN